MKLVIIFLMTAVFLLSLIIEQSSAQNDIVIDATTDKQKYIFNDPIIISGKISPVIEDKQVRIDIYDPSGHPAKLYLRDGGLIARNPFPHYSLDADGFFTTKYISPAIGPMTPVLTDENEIGTFTVVVTYGGISKEFDFLLSDTFRKDSNNTDIIPLKEQNTDINVETNLNVPWKNFTNDQSLFAIEYPSQWEVKAGNRFTDDPPLIAYNNNEDPSKVKSQLSVSVFDSEGLTAKKWAELKKVELVDKDKTTKLVEPINCNKYIINNVYACSFLYAGNDDTDKRAGILEMFVVDNSNMTHTIEYTADPTKFDSEEPIINHIVNSYKLINNYPLESDFSSVNTTDTFDNSSLDSTSVPPAATILLEEENNLTTSDLTENEIIDSTEDSSNISEDADFSAVPP